MGTRGRAAGDKQPGYAAAGKTGRTVSGSGSPLRGKRAASSRSTGDLAAPGPADSVARAWSPAMGETRRDAGSVAGVSAGTPSIRLAFSLATTTLPAMSRAARAVGVRRWACCEGSEEAVAAAASMAQEQLPGYGRCGTAGQLCYAVSEDEDVPRCQRRHFRQPGPGNESRSRKGASP